MSSKNFSCQSLTTINKDASKMNKILFYIILTTSLCSYGQNRKMYGDSSKTKFPILAITLKQCLDSNSIFYYKKIEQKFIENDTNITAEQVLSLTKYYVFTKKQNLLLLDSLSTKIYKLNESKQYEEAITISMLLLNICPNNLTGHKEIALAYKKTGNDSLSQKHFQVMVKLLGSIFKYGDGHYDYPFIINNFFEGISIYESAFRTRPSKTALMLSKNQRLLGSYYAYSSAVDNYLIRYSDLTHWKSNLKKSDYIIEGANK